MKNDEGIFKMLSKSSIIGNQYENVIPINLKQKFKKGSFYCPFFLIKCYKIIMSKRYSGKSFKDSSVSKKPKLSLKEKRKQKKEKTKKS
jgi:hypothetical protein